MYSASKFSALILSLAVSACAQVPSSEAAVGPPQPVADPTSASHCDASKTSDAIGQLPRAEVVEAARKAAGAQVVRTLRQGQPVTKEFQVGRLNLLLDARGKVASARCG
jgi:hypothetical protein